MEKVIDHDRPLQVILHHPRICGVHVAGYGLDLAGGVVLPQEFKKGLHVSAAFSLSYPQDAPCVQIHDDRCVPMSLMDGEFVNGQVFHTGEINFLE